MAKDTKDFGDINVEVVGSKTGALADPDKRGDLFKLARDFFDYASSKNISLQRDWFLYYRFVDGHQWEVINKSQGTVTVPTSLVGRRGDLMTINRVGQGMRNMIKEVTKSKPKAEVTPDKRILRNQEGEPEIAGTVDPADSTKKASRFLDWAHKELDITSKLQLHAKDCFTSGNSYVKIGWDKNADEGTGMATWEVYSPFDSLPDPDVMNPQDGRAWDLSSIKATTHIKERYGKNAIPEDLTSDSSFKNLLDQKHKNTRVSQDTKFGTAVVHETYLIEEKKVTEFIDAEQAAGMKPLEKNEEGQFINEDGEIITGERLIKNTRIKKTLFTVWWVKGQNLDIEENPLKDNLFPIVTYKNGDIPGSQFGQSTVAGAIDAQRGLNRMVTELYAHGRLIAGPKIVIQRGSGVRKPTNQWAEVLAFNAGTTPPGYLNPPSMPAYVVNLIEFFDSVIQDQMFTHDISKGKVPTGIKSGKGLEILKEADSSGLEPKIERLEDFLTKAYTKILRRMADFLSVPKAFNVLDQKDEDPGYYDIEPEDFADTVVSVSIGSWLSESKSAKIEQLQLLNSLGMIDKETFLKSLGAPNPEGIIEKLAEEAAQQALLEADKAEAIAEGQQALMPGQGTPQEQAPPAEPSPVLNQL